MISHTLLDQHSLISDQINKTELLVILLELEKLLQQKYDGAVVEFGCYAGTTSLFIRRLLDAYKAPNAFHVYDSFIGLPQKTEKDESPVGLQFIEGELAVSKKTFIQNFKKARLQVPIIHKCWFDELSNDDIPQEILFAFLDGDYYQSVKGPLGLIDQHMSNHATIIVDDYANDALPGARRALDEWAESTKLSVYSQQSLGIVHLQS